MRAKYRSLPPVKRGKLVFSASEDFRCLKSTLFDNEWWPLNRRVCAVLLDNVQHTLDSILAETTLFDFVGGLGQN